MKKYLSIAALLAAGTLVSNAVVLSTALTNTSESTSSSAYELLLGKTYATNNAGTAVTEVDGISKADRANVSFSQSVTLSGLYNASALTSLGSSVSLNSISVIDGAYPDSSKGKTAYLQIKNGESVIARSTNSVDTGVSGNNNTYGALTFTFSGVTLSTNTEYTVVAVDSDGTALSGTFRCGLFQADTNYSLSSDQITVGGNQWNPVLSVDVSAVPEPSAFGLLTGLGALALVASRRRRK